jgi:lia operon protein LiaF
MGNRNRNTAIVLIAAGLFLLVERHLGFFSMVALLLIGLGFYKVRTEEGKSGYVLIVIGAILLLGGHFSLIIPLLLIALGIFYIKSHKIQRDGVYIQKMKLIESYKVGREPWELKSFSLWHLIGEVNIDLTQAIPEQEESTIILQGAIGDVDIVVPDYLGVSVSTSAAFGQLDVVTEKEAGFMNKLVWQSPGYEQSAQKVRIDVSYLIADIDIKVL